MPRPLLLTRRAATLGLLTFAMTSSNTAASAASANKGPSLPMPLSPEQRERLLQALKQRDAQYDATEHLLTGRRGPEYQYHTNLRNQTVHPTRDSLHYAAALYDTGDAERAVRAEAILRRILALQDRDPARPSIGIWGWYAEEPPEKMSPPDYNWADFMGVRLLHIRLYHHHRLPADLQQDMDTALRLATAAIRKRNVGPGYTNIALMGAYVTLIAAEQWSDADLKGYALGRLRRFVEHTRANGGSFSEYNSPTYTIVALEEVARMRLHARDTDSRPLVEEIYRDAWSEIARHWHAPSQQWAGPHSRCYNTLLSKPTLAFLTRNLGGRLIPTGATDTPPGLDDHYLTAPCPDDLAVSFEKLEKPRTHTQTFIKHEQRPTIGTTYLAPFFTLGSVNRGDMWNQRRGLLAYWGKPEAPSYLHLRMLHDGYDFSAARLWCRQQEGRVLAGLTISTDGGDKHISLDRIKDATMQATDLRLRWEIGGAAAISLKELPPIPRAPAEWLRLPLPGDIALEMSVPYARLGEQAGRWEVGRAEKTLHLDTVLYAGEQRTFHLGELAEAVCAVALRIAPQEEQSPRIPAVSVRPEEALLRLAWGDLSLAVPRKPDKGAVLDAAAVV